MVKSSVAIGQQNRTTAVSILNRLSHNTECADMDSFPWPGHKELSTDRSFKCAMAIDTQNYLNVYTRVIA